MSKPVLLDLEGEYTDKYKSLIYLTEDEIKQSNDILALHSICQQMKVSFCGAMEDSDGRILKFTTIPDEDIKVLQKYFGNEFYLLNMNVNELKKEISKQYVRLVEEKAEEIEMLEDKARLKYWEDDKLIIPNLDLPIIKEFKGSDVIAAMNKLNYVYIEPENVINKSLIKADQEITDPHKVNFSPVFDIYNYGRGSKLSELYKLLNFKLPEDTVITVHLKDDIYIALNEEEHDKVK